MSETTKIAIQRALIMRSPMVVVYGPASTGKTYAVLSAVSSWKPEKQHFGVGKKRKRAETIERQSYVCYLSGGCFPQREWQQIRKIIIMEIAKQLGVGKQSMKSSAASVATAASFGHLLQQYCQRIQARQSHLFLVIDDAHLLPSEAHQEMDLWLSASKFPDALSIWVLSRRYSRFHSCTCYIPLTEKPAIAHSSLGDGSESLVPIAVQFFERQRPMATSIIAKDRNLLCNYTAAQVLHSEADKDNLNPVGMVHAWHRSFQQGSGATSDAVLFQELPYSAKVLLLACFYCGAVSPAKDAAVFGDQGIRSSVRWRTKARCHTGDTLISSIFSIHSSRLASIYAAMVKMVIHTEEEDCIVGNPAQLALPSNVVLHHLVVFERWGIMLPLTNNKSAYYCQLASQTAVDLADSLGIKLGHLVPDIA